jgi:hypothetical protein
MVVPSVRLACAQDRRSRLEALESVDNRPRNILGRATLTTQGIITMVVVLLFVWGGFALFVTAAVRRERTKAAERDPAARNWRD